MKVRNKRNLTIGILCCLLVFMGVGFAVARTTLNIGGTSTAINTWDVRMTNITVITMTDGVVNKEETKINDDGVTADLHVDFVKPGDYIKYEILVENNGSIDATLGTLDINLSSDNVMDKYLFQVDSTFPENAKLEAGEKVSFEVTIQYKEEASNLPEGEVKFDIKLNYSQGEGNNGGGNIPETEKEWDYIVNDSREIIAYNYDLGTDVVIPATNYEGKEIKSVTSKSFQNKNIEYYQDPSTGQVHSVIYEEEPNFSVVKEKAIILFAIETCGSTACVPQIEAVLTMYKAGEYTFPNGVTASYYINPDPSVEINNSVESIKRNISTLDLSNATNLTTIGEDAFYNSGLTDVEFGDNSNVTTIGDSAFYSNQISGELVIPDGVTTIGDSAFSRNQISGELVIPDGVTTIGDSAFYSNQISGELVIPDGVTTIGDSAFSRNQISGELIIPNSVTTIEMDAFFSNQISSLTLGGAITTIGNSAFESNQISGELIIPNSVTTIGNSAFSSNQISSLTLGGAITTIGDSAFRLNQISGELIIPDSVTTIGSYAFAGNSVDRLNIQSSNITIGEMAFNSNKITNLLMNKGVVIEPRAFNDNRLPDSQAFIYENNKDSGKIVSYGGAKRENIIIPNVATAIGQEAFAYLYIKGELVVSDSVVVIGESAFSNNQITSLILGTAITTIEKGAFYENEINDLVLPNKVATIGEMAFASNQIGNLIMNQEIVIEQEAFNNNQLPDSQAFIYANNKDSGRIVSYGGAKRENIIIPNVATAIGQSAFDNLDIKGELVIPDSVTLIEKTAFFSNQISSLIIPSSVIEIQSFAFLNQWSYDNNIGTNYLSSIVIKRTEQDFLANVAVGDYWYDDSLNPTITYDPS